MVEIEKIKEIEKTERQKIKESIRLRKEKEKLGEFERAVVECPECKSHTLVHDYKRAELVCNECGLVVGVDFIDHGPEWGALDHDQTMKRSRVGAPMTYTIHDKGLSTMIDWRNRDSSGKSVSPQTRAQLYHMRKWQRRIRLSNAAERNLAFALSELDRMESALGLSQSVRESAALIYRKAVKKDLIRGRSIEGVGSAALYAACRQCSIPRTLNEISEVSRVRRKEIGRTYRLVSKKLGLKLIPISPVEYVPRFCSGLNLHGEIQAKIIEILRQASEKELTNGRDPVSVAAAAIYIASILCNDRRNQSEIAKVAGTTEVTIRNRYKELANGLGIEMLI